MFTPTLQKLSTDDIPALVKLAHAVKWDYNEEEVRTILALGPMYGHKDEHGRLLSSAGVIQYEGGITALGMVIVDPSFHRRGLGHALMAACMEAVPPATPIMLIATEMGRPLYEKFGFSVVDTVHKFICERFVSWAPEVSDGVEIVPMTTDELEGVIRFDEKAVGTIRAAFLQERIKQAKQCLVAKDADGSIKGYGLAVQGPVNLVAGPIAASDHNLAVRLLCRLAENHRGNVRIDVPDGQFSFIDALERNGFVKSNQPPVMIARASRMPQRNGTYFSIASQFFG